MDGLNKIIEEIEQLIEEMKADISKWEVEEKGARLFIDIFSLDELSVNGLVNKEADRLLGQQTGTQVAILKLQDIIDEYKKI